MELSQEEIALVKAHRLKQEKINNERKLYKTIVYIFYKWISYSNIDEIGLTFSTFCSESEFNVNQYLESELTKYRKFIYDGMLFLINNLNGYIKY